MDNKIFWFTIHVSVLLVCLACELGILIKPSFGDIPTTDIPLFELLDKEVTQFDGGVNVTLTLRNYGNNATSGSVWIPWEKVWYGTPLSGVPPSGNITEALLPFDINGDGDTSDVFTVSYVDNKTVEVDGVTANSMFIPEQRIYYEGKGIYDVLEKNSFKLGSENHTVTRVRYLPEYDMGYAGFGLESFFRDHQSPNIEFNIDQKGTSINSTSAVEIISMELNGTLTSYEFNWTEPWLDFDGQWYFSTVYVYSLGFLNSGTVFTVRLSIRGEPGSYLLTTILNWAPDNLHRYRYFVLPDYEIPFALTGTTHRDIRFEGDTYPIEILTNSTISPIIAFNSTAKEISFNATGYGGLTFFWNITIPQNLLRDNPWKVTLGDTPIAFIPATNGTHTFLYFNYTYPQTYWFETSRISIKGTWVIPEFSPALMLLLFITTTLLATTVYKRKRVIIQVRS